MGKVSAVCAALLCVIAVVLVPVGRVMAHSEVDRSIPSAGAVLEQAPLLAQLWFTEQPDPGFSQLQVLDSQGIRVDNNDMHAAPGDSSSLIVTLKANLPNGAYAIVWKALSAVDGHESQGILPFYIGTETPVVPLPPTPTAPAYAPGGIAAEGVLRWALLAGLLLTTGTFAFAALVWWRTARALNLSSANWTNADTLIRRLAWLALIGIIVAVVVTVALACLQTARVNNGAFFPALMRLLSTTRIGQAAVARFMLTLLTALLAWRWMQKPRSDGLPVLGLVGALASLLTMSVAGHSAAAQWFTVPAIAADWLHTVAAGVWAGGLPALLAGILFSFQRLETPSRGKLAALLFSNFSDTALVAVVVISTTGLFSAYMHVGSLKNVAGSPYALTLIAKTVVFVGVIGVGAVNLLYVRPRLQRFAQARAGAEHPARLLRRTISIEIFLVALIVLASGLLGSMNPARRAPMSTGQEGRVVSYYREAWGLTMTFQVQQTSAAKHRIAVELRDERGLAEGFEKGVIRLTYLVKDVGTSEVNLLPEGKGVYAAEGVFLPLAGTWNIEFLPIRPRQGAIPEQFKLTLVASGLVYPVLEPTAPPTKSRAYASLGIGGALLLLGLAGVFRGGMLPKRRRRQALVLAGSGLMAGLMGMTLVITGFRATQTPDVVPILNPIPATPDSIAAGSAIYQQQCLTCHGANGHGDGPAARGLAPLPADFSIHVPLHSDGQLFYWIGNGLPGTAMQPFKSKLSERERWDVLNYIKSTFVPQER